MSDPTPEALAFSEVHIEAFRRLTDVHLTGLRHLNLVVGDNNVGKTSVLEAVWLLARGATAETLGLLQGFRVPEGVARERFAEACFSLAHVEGSGRTGRASIRAEGPRTKKRHVAIRFSRTGPGAIEVVGTQQGKGGIGPISGPFHAVVPLLAPFTDDKSQVPVVWVGIDSHRNENTQADLLDSATRMGIKHSLVDLLQLVDPEVRALSTSGAGGSFHTLVELASFALALPHFGDAVRRLLFLAMSITSIPNGVLLVDEAEASIHWSRFPDMARALLRLLREFNVQAFFTTHSLELIDAFVDATPDRDDVALYRLMRAPEDGKTVVASIAEADLKAMRHEFGMEVR